MSRGFCYVIYLPLNPSIFQSETEKIDMRSGESFANPWETNTYLKHWELWVDVGQKLIAWLGSGAYIGIFRCWRLARTCSVEAGAMWSARRGWKRWATVRNEVTIKSPPPREEHKYERQKPQWGKKRLTGGNVSRCGVIIKWLWNRGRMIGGLQTAGKDEAGCLRMKDTTVI